MKNTKFIKVSTADRLPVEKDYYDTNLGFIEFNPQTSRWAIENDWIEYWLQEVPDYEEDLESMVDELIWELRITEDPGRHTEMIDKANSLLTKLKTES